MTNSPTKYRADYSAFGLRRVVTLTFYLEQNLLHSNCMNSAFQPLFSINLLLEQKNCSS